MAQGEGGGSLQKDHDPYYCCLVLDSQLSFDRKTLKGESNQLKLTFPIHPCLYEEFGSSPTFE